MTDKCANPKCNKPLIHIEGRRKKKYCSQKCNSAHWQALHYVPSDRKKKFKRIPIKEYEELLVKINENKNRILEERNPTTVTEKSTRQHPLTENEATKIKRPTNLLELKELCPYKDGSDERRVWISTERQKYGV